jgi:hypothetical protein
MKIRVSLDDKKDMSFYYKKGREAAKFLLELFKTELVDEKNKNKS